MNTRARARRTTNEPPAWLQPVEAGKVVFDPSLHTAAQLTALDPPDVPYVPLEAA